GEAEMPVGMMRLTTATPESLVGLHDQPDQVYQFIVKVLKAYADEVPEATEPKLQHLYFDIGRERAYAVITDLDDYVAVKAVARLLGAEGFLKLVEVDGAEAAVKLEGAIRERLSQPPAQTS